MRRFLKGFTVTDNKRGFTDRLAIACLRLIWTGLLLSFILAILSIRTGYTGQLACWTVVFTPVGTMLGVVMTAVVRKNEKENTCSGKGINYLKAENTVSRETEGGI